MALAWVPAWALGVRPWRGSGRGPLWAWAWALALAWVRAWALAPAVRAHPWPRRLDRDRGRRLPEDELLAPSPQPLLALGGVGRSTSSGVLGDATSGSGNGASAKVALGATRHRSRDDAASGAGVGAGAGAGVGAGVAAGVGAGVAPGNGAGVGTTTATMPASVPTTPSPRGVDGTRDCGVVGTRGPGNGVGVGPGRGGPPPASPPRGVNGTPPGPPSPASPAQGVNGTPSGPRMTGVVTRSHTWQDGQRNDRMAGSSSCAKTDVVIVVV